MDELYENLHSCNNILPLWIIHMHVWMSVWFFVDMHLRNKRKRPALHSRVVFLATQLASVWTRVWCCYQLLSPSPNFLFTSYSHRCMLLAGAFIQLLPLPTSMRRNMNEWEASTKSYMKQWRRFMTMHNIYSFEKYCHPCKNSILLKNALTCYPYALYGVLEVKKQSCTGFLWLWIIYSLWNVVIHEKFPNIFHYLHYLKKF